MSETNQDQRTYWNDRAARTWVEWQKKLDEMLAPFGEAAFDALAPKAGEHILDVGCGTGTTTLKIAEAVGSGGSVTGLDISRPMLGHAQARAAVTPEYNIELIAGDAQTHPLPPARFDAVFSRFGVMFFEDPAAAFANLLRAVKPGGRLAFVAWRDPRDNPWATEPTRLARAHVEVPPRPGPDDPGQFSFADPERVERLLAAGGWIDTTLQRFDIEHCYAPDVETAVERGMRMGPHAGALADAAPEVRQALEGELRALFEERAKNGEISYSYSTWIVSARRPA